MLGLCISCKGYPSHIDGWAEKEAGKWATGLGYPNAPVICKSFVGIYGQDIGANCSVNINGTIYELVCNFDDYSGRRWCVLVK